MARKLPPVNTLTDTWQIVINRVNDLVDSLDTEIITANSTIAETGSALSPRNARLYGSFTANTLVADNLSVGGGVFAANNSRIVIGNQVRIQANNATGSVGQVLASGGLTGNVYWASVGTGTVTQVANGAGLTGGPITTAGSLAVRPGTGIVVDSNGVSVNAAHISSLSVTNWAVPGQLGRTTANTGNFTDVNALSYSIGSGADFFVSSSGVYTRGAVDCTTPNVGTSGGLRVRAIQGGVAYLQFTNYFGNAEFGYFTVNSVGELSWNGKRLDFPSGTKMLFVQTSAPPGWTKLTTADNAALRVVSGTAGSGGSMNFTTAFTARSVSGAVGDTALTADQIPAHRHNMFDIYDTTQFYELGDYPSNTPAWGSNSGGNTEYSMNTNLSQNASVGITGATGGGLSHTHSFFGSAIDFAVKYVDAIIAQKD